MQSRASQKSVLAGGGSDVVSLPSVSLTKFDVTMSGG